MKRIMKIAYLQKISKKSRKQFQMKFQIKIKAMPKIKKKIIRIMMTLWRMKIKLNNMNKTNKMTHP